MDRQPVPKPVIRRPVGPLTGKLDVGCTPWCHLYVDEHDTGRNSPVLGLELPTGSHQLKLVNPPTGMERVKVVDIEAGKTAQAIIHF